MAKSKTRHRQAKQYPHPPADRNEDQPAEKAAKPAGEVRVDPPHEVCKAPQPPEPQVEESNPNLAGPAAGGDVAASQLPDSCDAVAQRLRTQAAQLAAHLGARQQELDHREGELNARAAELDRDLRTARLWLAEREADLNGRDEEAAARERQVVQRLARLAVAETAQEGRAQTPEAIAGREEGLQRREAALQLEQQQLDARREVSLQLVRQLLAGVERQRQAVEQHAQKIGQRSAQPSPELLAREESLRRRAEDLEARTRNLTLVESRLAEARVEAQRLCDELLQQRSQLQEDALAQRERLAAEHRQAIDELERKRQAVERRADHADHRHTALEQLRGELERMHRETLEIRLATEELWVRLSGAAPPAALSRSLGRIRSKLAEHYCQADAELRGQKEELEGLRRQMIEQHAKLVEHKRQVERWAAARLEQAEQQAARLVAREDQLRAREAELQDQSHRWRAERLEFQHEIRRLRARLPGGEEAGCPR